MRDFNNGGDIIGNVTIHDNSVEYKPLNQCSNEELAYEEKHRQDILNKEQDRKNSIFFKFIGVSVGLCIIAFLWYSFSGGHSFASTALGASGVLLAFFSIGIVDTKTEFENRQISVLHEIHMLFRERGVR